MEHSIQQSYPVILGKVPVTKNYNRPKGKKASKCIEILDGLTEGYATLIDFDDKKEAQDYRSMLYTMSILKFGKAGCIGTRLDDTVLHVWLIPQTMTE